MNVAFDFGITNTDVVINNDSKNHFFTFPTEKIDKQFIAKILNSIEVNLNAIKNIAVTGGKSDNLDDEFMSIPVTKINEVNAIGRGVKELYKTDNNPFLAISAGTGTACIYHADGKFNYLGGISIGGGTLQGLSKHLINNTNNEEIQELAITGNRKQLDYLIGDIATEIGSLNSEITASNFAKAKDLDRLSPNDIAASITNMIGEVIGTVAYLNAKLCGENKVYFSGRVSLNTKIKGAIEDRLRLADITGIFEDNREYANVLGALVFLNDKIT